MHSISSVTNKQDFSEIQVACTNRQQSSSYQAVFRIICQWHLVLRKMSRSCKQFAGCCQEITSQSYNCQTESMFSRFPCNLSYIFFIALLSTYFKNNLPFHVPPITSSHLSFSHTRHCIGPMYRITLASIYIQLHPEELESLVESIWQSRFQVAAVLSSSIQHFLSLYFNTYFKCLLFVKELA